MPFSLAFRGERRFWSWILLIACACAGVRAAGASGDDFTIGGPVRRGVDRFVDGSKLWECSYPNCEKKTAAMLEQEHHSREVGDKLPLAKALSWLGNKYDIHGRPKKAEDMLQESLDIRQSALPPDHPDIAAAFHNLGAHYEWQNSHEKAVEYYERALKIWENSPLSNPTIVARELSDLGDYYYSRHNHAQAESLLKRSLAVNDKHHLRDYRTLIDTLNNLTCIMDEERRGEELKVYEKRQEEAEKQRAKFQPYHGLSGSGPGRSGLRK